MKWFGKKRDRLLPDAEPSLDKLSEEMDALQDLTGKETERPDPEGHLECYATVLAKDMGLINGSRLDPRRRIGHWMQVRLDDGREETVSITEELYNSVAVGERSLLLMEQGVLLDFGDRLGEEIEEDVEIPDGEYRREEDEEKEEEWLGPLDVSRVPCIQEPSPPADPLDVRIAQNELELKVPEVYRDFLLQMNGAHTTFAWLYSVEELVKRNRELELETLAPGYLSIGNDNIMHELLMKAETDARRVLLVSEEALDCVKDPDLTLPSFDGWVEAGLPNPWE